eukprot:CAMPEP_0184480718 /NCGR_PEP_ID=MMETSP0113_2-20130426/2235_1 /TAXON_ID=91329 /ORGANISM="Norrisiella sphaerica, Strain BC52" /LENGTH=682 /DNA_ID=CAMNT_0026859389 /DNA_START=292 /DNA_END=2340 /DNA_ORIENTATION=-
MADEKVCIGPPASADSYLRQDRILEVIKQTGAEAVHPGYGFLSENSDFSKAVEELGAKFIGPKEYAIDSMGDKIHSKKIALDAKVNTIPGFVGEVHDDTELLKACNEIGYPVMIKASAGGGGKGMRIAWNDEEARKGFQLSKREAAASFGDDTIFVEKFIENPRHIEIQILVDSFGNGTYLNERECSVQRRNQKVMEEAPSSFVDPATRAAMGKQALQLAAAVGYQSAGTVEFLMDKNKDFYFLEMNTRLQVEHPITEMTTKVDIVEEMINIAAGRKLRYKQSDIGIHGWAFESRVYAEDPYREFLPSIGLLTKYREPTGSHVRVDTGVTEGSEISMFYDPMISKLCTHGDTRAQALERMRHALDSYHIQGLRQNLSFLHALCDHPSFISGDITTKFIEEHYPEGFQGIEMNELDWVYIAATAYAAHGSALIARASIATGQDYEFALKYARETMEEVILNIKDGPTLKVTLSSPELDPDDEFDEFEQQLDMQQLMAQIQQEAGDRIRIEVIKTPADSAEEGAAVRELSIETGQFLPAVSLQTHYKEGDDECKCSLHTAGGSGVRSDVTVQVISSETPDYKLVYHGEEFEINVMAPRVYELTKHMPVVIPVDTSKMVLSPMPGLIYSVNVKEGDKVELGEEVVVVEAMKMQNALQAPASGKISKILVAAGDSVDADQILIELE